MRLFVLMVVLSAQVGGSPRYAFHENTTQFPIPRFLSKADCDKAGQEMAEPLTRAGYSVKTWCEERQ